jgi:hypothetical protein
MECEFQLVKADEVVIDGLPSTADLTIRACGRTLGRLRGFIVERAQQQVRYIVVRASGLFTKSTLIPFSDVRIDVDGRVIDVDIDEQAIWQLRNFTPDQLLTT